MTTTSKQAFVAGCIGVATFVAVWWASVSFSLIDHRILPSPLELLRRVLLLEWTSVGLHIWVSLQRVVLGGLVGGVCGLVMGVLIGWNSQLRMVLSLPLELLRPIPPLAWIPLAIIWFGIGDASKVFVIGLGCFFVMLTNTEKGIRDFDPALIRQGRSYGLQGFALMRRVILPGIRPDLMVGASISTSLAFASLVAAELLGADTGLGYLIMRGRLDGDFTMVLIAISLIAILAYVLDVMVRRLIVPHGEAYRS